jgi:hypothetical protein
MFAIVLSNAGFRSYETVMPLASIHGYIRGFSWFVAVPKLVYGISCTVKIWGFRRKRAVRKVSSHFEYLENRSRGLDVTWQPVREDLTMHP